MKKLGDDFDFAHRPHDSGHGQQVKREASQSLRCGESLPDPFTPTRRTLYGWARCFHWKTFLNQLEKSSDTMMIAMMASKIVITKS